MTLCLQKECPVVLLAVATWMDRRGGFSFLLISKETQRGMMAEMSGLPCGAGVRGYNHLSFWQPLVTLSFLVERGEV